MARSHLPKCARIYAAVFNRPPWDGKWTVRTAAKHIQESFQDPNFRGIVALDDSRPIGFAYGLVQQWEGERRFYLKEMCVESSRQRSGAGSHLLASLIKRLKVENVRQISLRTGRGTPAERFYSRLGFEIDPQIISMTKRLQRGPPLRPN